jgi:uncharacterized protein
MVNALHIDYDVLARMRDGTALVANIFRPDDSVKYPVALARTPYGKDYMTGFPYLDIIRLAKCGYIVIVQDVRGRGGSEGTFEPFINEGKDGYDSVEWAAGLEGSSGNVGMWGFSYLSYTQWAAALMNPPSLKCITPTFTPTDFTNGVYWRGGAFELGLIVHLLINSLGMEDIFKKFAADPAKLGPAISTFVEEVDRIPFGGVNSLDLTKIDTFENTGIGAEYVKFLLDNYLDERFSKFPYALKKRLAEVKIPSLNIAGWNDIFLQDTIDSFTAQHAAGHQTKLLIGPWAHLNFSGTVGENEYGMAASMSFINKEYDHVALIQKWFDHWLGNQDNRFKKEPPVMYFVSGENIWHTDTQWPPKDITLTSYYLQPYGGLSIDRPSKQGQSAGYKYNPANPLHTHGGAILMHPYFITGPRDQQFINTRDDLLVFTTAVLTDNLHLVGPVQVRLWISTSAVDTDFIATLLDVHPDGKTFNLTDGIIRAKFRNGNQPELLSPSEIYELTIDLWSVGHAFLKGHKLALRVTSSNFPRWDRNLNNDGTSSELVTAEQTIYMDTQHPSHILLPVSLKKA